VIGKCGHSFHMVCQVEPKPLLRCSGSDGYAALSPYLDTTRLVERIVSDVQAK